MERGRPSPRAERSEVTPKIIDEYFLKHFGHQKINYGRLPGPVYLADALRMEKEFRAPGSVEGDDPVVRASRHIGLLVEAGAIVAPELSDTSVHPLPEGVKSIYEVQQDLSELFYR